MWRWVIYTTIIAAFIGGLASYQQMIRRTALYKQSIAVLAEQYNKKAAEHERDLAVLDKAIKKNQTINRLANDLKAQLQKAKGCTVTAIDADTIKWVREYRDNQVPARTSATKPNP